MIMATKKNTQINGKNYYRITKTIGHQIVDGKKTPIRKAFYGESKTQAVKKYQEWLIQQEKLKEQTVDSNLPLGKVIDSYIENVLTPSAKYQESTKSRYIGAYNTFKDNAPTDILAKTIQDVTSADWQNAYNKCNIKQSTLTALNSLLQGFYKWAVLNRYCMDVLNVVSIPKKERPIRNDDVTIFTDEELELIDIITVGHRLRLMTFLGRYAGLRISEVLGLKYSDFTDDTIKVRRQNYRGEVKPPKYNSVRDIPLHPVLKEELEKHREWHLEEMKRLGYKSDYLFTTTVGTAYDDATIRKRFRKLFYENGVPEYPFHTFRHTFCTNLCRAEVPIQVASKLMGHKSVEVTAKFYTLVDKDEQKAAINLLK